MYSPIFSLRVLLVALAMVTASTFVEAQSETADSLQAWQDLQRQAYANPGQGLDATSTRNQLATTARSAATAAKNYYTAFPASTKASEARKLEIIWSLKGITDGDGAYEASAQNLAKKFRADSTNPEQDRFEVATLTESVGDRAKLTTDGARNGGEVEAIADKLLTEFSDLPAAYDYYASVAGAADMNTGAGMAQKLLRSATATDVKNRAQEILDRKNLIGTTPSISLTAIDGTAIDLTNTAGKWSIVYACSPKAIPTAIAWIQSPKHQLSAKLRFVFLVVGTTADGVKSATAKLSIPGTLCAEPAPLDTGTTTAILKIRHLPWVYVFDDSGKLQGFGPPDQLPTLIPANIR